MGVKPCISLVVNNPFFENMAQRTFAGKHIFKQIVETALRRLQLERQIRQ